MPQKWNCKKETQFRAELQPFILCASRLEIFASFFRRTIGNYQLLNSSSNSAEPVALHSQVGKKIFSPAGKWSRKGCVRLGAVQHRYRQLNFNLNPSSKMDVGLLRNSKRITCSATKPGERPHKTNIHKKCCLSRNNFHHYRSVDVGSKAPFSATNPKTTLPTCAGSILKSNDLTKFIWSHFMQRRCFVWNRSQDLWPLGNMPALVDAPKKDELLSSNSKRNREIRGRHTWKKVKRNSPPVK